MFEGRVLIDNYSFILPTTLFNLYVGLVRAGRDTERVRDKLRGWWKETYPDIDVEKFDDALKKVRSNLKGGVAYGERK